MRSGADTNWRKKDTALSPQKRPYVGGVGSVFGAMGSLRDAGRAAGDLRGSNQSLSTDADTAALGISSLSAATGASATAARSIEAARLGVSTSQTVGNAVMAGAGTAAAGLSVATGSIDVIRGVAGAGLAQSRANELDAIQGGANTSVEAAALAGSAATGQRDKRNDRLITAGKGALSVAGGAILLAAGLTNPIGLGLLAGAAIIGGGVALYRWWNGRKKAAGTGTLAGQPAVSATQQESADRMQRATELWRKRTEPDYKRILLAIGISRDKLESGKVTINDIEKALRPR